MNRTWCIPLIAALALSAAGDQKTERKLQAQVDPRVELMSIIFRLAGNPEYNPPNSQSPYAAEVAEHFGRFAEHPVIQLARRLRNERGVSYDAVMSMAVHLDDAIGLQERIPFDQNPARLDARWRLAEAREFLKLARKFVKDADFTGFVKTHRGLYDTAGERLAAQLAERDYLGWFDAFFGARPGASFTAMVGLLNGGNCYGVGVRFPDGREEICPVIGAWSFDEQGAPTFDDKIAPTVVHELCHSYTNPLVDKYASLLEPAGKGIFPRVAAAMQRQAYGNWKTMMYESLVRACVIRYQLAHDGKQVARQAVTTEQSRGFKWMGDLVKLLGEYEKNRERYATLDDFMPQVVVFFERYSQEFVKTEPAAQAQAAAGAPQVVSMTPPNGATDVDPNLKAITITFDRPMKDKCWSVCGGGPSFPEVTGQIAYDAERKVLTIPVRLKPGWTYQLGINCESYRAFMSADGVPLEPVAVTFTTSK